MAGPADRWEPSLEGPDTLLTNEHAARHPDDATARHDPAWVVTAGSLFRRGGRLWTGVPDRRAPDARSRTGTGSAVFRAVSRRRDLQDVSIRLQIGFEGFVGAIGEGDPWDGIHVLLRYCSPAELYAASVVRRDGVVCLKRKVPGGPSNGGTYTTLAQARRPLPRAGDAVEAEVTVRTTERATVALSLVVQGEPLLAVEDAGGPGASPILGPGGIGLRGDAAQFTVGGLRVDPARP